MHLIPKMVKLHFSIKKENVLLKFLEDNSYFISRSNFNLREIKIGPFSKKVDLKIDICDFRFKNIEIINVEKTFIPYEREPNMYYFNIAFKDKFKIDSDIKITVKGGNIEFYIWANLWYSCYACLKEFLEISKLQQVK